MKCLAAELRWLGELTLEEARDGFGDPVLEDERDSLGDTVLEEERDNFGEGAGACGETTSLIPKDFTEANEAKEEFDKREGEGIEEVVGEELDTGLRNLRVFKRGEGRAATASISLMAGRRLGLSCLLSALANCSLLLSPEGGRVVCPAASFVNDRSKGVCILGVSRGEISSDESIGGESDSDEYVAN